MAHRHLQTIIDHSFGRSRNHFYFGINFDTLVFIKSDLVLLTQLNAPENIACCMIFIDELNYEHDIASLLVLYMTHAETLTQFSQDDKKFLPLLSWIWALQHIVAHRLKNLKKEQNFNIEKHANTILQSESEVSGQSKLHKL